VRSRIAQPSTRGASTATLNQLGYTASNQTQMYPELA
jgi:hypothetical protein